MRWVSLNDDRAAGCKRRNCVAARHGESQREITSAENSHWPQWYFAHPQVRTGLWRAIRNWCIQPSIKPATIANYRGEKFQLAYSADAFALDAGLWQTGFGACAVNQRFAEIENSMRNCLQEVRPEFKIGLTIWVESRFRQ
jgi:hypothetical protein